jgi:hypothetical protein
VRLLLKRFFQNGDPFVKTQRIFRKHFKIARRGNVPWRNSVQLWAENFRTNSSALKNKPPGCVRAGRSPKNIEAVRQSFIKRPRRSARRCSVAVGISDRSMEKIL